MARLDSFALCSILALGEMMGNAMVKAGRDASENGRQLDQKAIGLWGNLDRSQKLRMLEVMKRLIRHQGEAKSP